MLFIRASGLRSLIAEEGLFASRMVVGGISLANFFDGLLGIIALYLPLFCKRGSSPIDDL
jgi:hypothetical protein